MGKKKARSNVGIYIKNYRIKSGETQQELADYLGYGATTIANYESGYRLPDIHTLQRIAEHYHISLEDLVK